MKRITHVFQRLLLAAACGAAAMPAAQAGVVTFEGLGNGLLGHGDVLRQAGMLISAFSTADAPLPGELAGALVDGGDPGACAGLACPAGHPGNYYAALNDSAIFLDPVAADTTFRLKGFDASFIGAVAGAPYPALAGLLMVLGFASDGNGLFELYSLAGPDADGFHFAHFDTSAGFGERDFAEVGVLGYTCDVSGDCAASSDHRGQFAIDNIAIVGADADPAQVAEPASWLLMLAGLAGMASGGAAGPAAIKKNGSPGFRFLAAAARHAMRPPLLRRRARKPSTPTPASSIA